MHFLNVSVHEQYLKRPQTGRAVFLTNPDLANILGRTDLDFEIFFRFFWGFQIPRFPGPQISRSPEILPGPGLGRVGPVGPQVGQVAPRVGPRVGPRSSFYSLIIVMLIWS